MKSKILTLIIGILIGAIITTAGFLIYNKTVAQNSTQPEMMQMNGNNQMGEPPSGDGENGEMPEKPDGDDGEEPPSKPEGDDSEEQSTNTNSN